MSTKFTATPETGQGLSTPLNRLAQRRLRRTGPTSRKRPTEDSTTRMFAGIRQRMVLWYSVVLAVILVVAGLLVYGAMNQIVLGGVPHILTLEANEQVGRWVSPTSGVNAANAGCNPQAGELPIYFVACYDTHGSIIYSNPPDQRATLFLSQAGIVQRALTSSDGVATDWVSGKTTLVRASSSQPQQMPPPADEQAATPAQGVQINRTIARYATVVPGPNGKALGVALVGYDISGQVEALANLRLLLFIIGGLALLACGVSGVLLANRALGPARLAFTRQQTFIADASHELRTPLTLMRANAEVLLSNVDALPADDVPLLNSLVAEVEHMGAVTTQLLELARLDAGGAHIEQEALHLGSLTAILADQARALATSRGVALSLDITSDPVVIGDRVQLTEVALILLDNAIKYNATGGRVTLRVAETNDEATLTVTDTGPGISPEHLARLGERFYRVDKARSRKLGGAGLGLSIAHRIATLHGGTLTLTSEVGHGTVATLSLPAAHKDSAQ